MPRLTSGGKTKWFCLLPTKMNVLDTFHGLGAGGVEASDVDGKVALEVGYGDGKWVRSVGFGAGVCCGVEEVG
jgi:hypothetical protein